MSTVYEEEAVASLPNPIIIKALEELRMGVSFVARKHPGRCFLSDELGRKENETCIR
ncbi:unnamed protein product [Dovyalis caffra]|uniref:Uncharacterized protein n=1 Tax=Dovyalis caffra TaxID=77055 RepID=A0AAV1RG95_9ROSI|nr:unnamed protein product [Dovyalis caffra]